MSGANRSFFVIVAIFLVVGAGAYWLNHAVSDSGSAPTAPAKMSTASTQAAASQPTTTRASGVAYRSNFERTVGPQWSIRHLAMTPKEPKRKFLGPIRETPLAFTLDNLPPHELVHVTFDLLTFEPWNGDSRNFGRDLWDMRVDGGQPLIHTTFSNCGFFNDNNEQSFPDQYPWYPAHKGWTGAMTKQTLGYKSSWGPARQFGTDSVYHIDITFPHSGETLGLNFQSQIKHRENKPYGFLNFEVETIEHFVKPTDVQMEAWWRDLNDADPEVAFKALWLLASTGDTAAKYVSRHLPAALPDVPINIDPEAEFVPGSFQIGSPEERQFMRAIHLLEVINSDSSKKLLEEIGYKGTPVKGPPTHLNPQG